jgi:hypothetical protein
MIWLDLAKISSRIRRYHCKVTPGPLGDLLGLDVLEPPLVETDPDGGTEPLLSVVSRQVAQLLYLDLV